MQQFELEQSPRKNLEFLVVDGDPIVRLLHTNRLHQNFSFPISNFENGREALEFIQTHPGTDYMVLLAIEMAVMNGWTFLNELRSLDIRPQVYVAMVSSSVSIHDKNLALSYPSVLEYFEKPLTRFHLQKLPLLPKLIPYFVSVN